MTDFSEFFCSLLLLFVISLDFVRMHLQSELAVGALDCRLIRGAMDVENVIIITPANTCIVGE